MTRHEAWWAAGLLLVALAFRLAGLGRESLWEDEFYSLLIGSHATAGEVIRYVWFGEPHPPLHFLIVHFLLPLTGDGNFGLRLPWALMGAATVPLYFVLLRRLVPGQFALAVLATALLAASPMHIWYSQEMRHYPLLILLEVSVLLCLAAHARHPHSPFPIPCSLFLSLLSLYTHYFSAFFLMVAGAVCLAAVRRNVAGRPMMIASLAAAGAATIPAVIHIRARMTTLSWLPDRLTWADAPQIVQGQLIGPLYYLLPAPAYYTVAALGGALIAVGIVAIATSPAVPRGTRWLILGGLAATMGGPVLVSLVLRPIIFHGQRYLIIALPFVLACVAAACVLGPRWRRIAACAMLGIMLLAQANYLAAHYTRRQKRTYDSAAAYLDAQMQPADRAVMIPTRAAGLMERYMKAKGRLGGAEDVTPELLAETAAGGRLFLIAWGDPRDVLEAAGIPRARVGLMVFEATRPGLEIWIATISAR